LVDSSTERHPVLMQDGPGPASGDTPIGTDGKLAYDTRRLTYANTFDNPWKATTIRTMEWLTGKITILRMLREFQRRGPHTHQGFWKQVFQVMRIDIKTPQYQIDRIPTEGPVIIVSNHPHGLVDGMLIAELVSRKRLDFKILSRSILTGIDEIAASYLISVPFPHEEDSQRKGLEMRAASMKQLADGGVIALFPSGVVASSETLMGPAIEAEWNVFTAKMIRRSGATVLPLYFPGSNSRLYQIANQISATLRQGLLLHEIVAACKKPQAPVIGKPITPEEMADLSKDPRAFMTWLRDRTLSLKDRPDG
jgi:putative hemolysin